MQRTVHIADDVFEAAQKIADSQDRSIDEVISELARQALKPKPIQWETRNGVPLIPKRFGSKPVTTDMVNALRDDDY